MTQPIPPVDLAALAALELAATRGPWHVEYLGAKGYPQRIANDAAVLVAETFDGPNMVADNAELIVALRNAAPELIAELEQTRAELADVTAISGEVTAIVTAAMDCATEILADHPDAETNLWLKPTTRALVAAVARFATVASPAAVPQANDERPCICFQTPHLDLLRQILMRDGEADYADGVLRDWQDAIDTAVPQTDVLPGMWDAADLSGGQTDVTPVDRIGLLPDIAHMVTPLPAEPDDDGLVPEFVHLTQSDLDAVRAVDSGRLAVMETNAPLEDDLDAFVAVQPAEFHAALATVVKASGGEQATGTCTRCGHPAHWHGWLSCGGDAPGGGDCDCKRALYAAPVTAAPSSTAGGEQP